MERKPITVRPVEGFDPYDYVFRQRDEITGNPVISEITGEEKKYHSANEHRRGRNRICRIIDCDLTCTA